MRDRKENPHALPPRLYERISPRRITWWSKARDGTTQVLRAVPATASEEQIQAARAVAISLHSVAQGRQKRPNDDIVRQWVINAGVSEKTAIQIRHGLPVWALQLHQNSKRRALSRNIIWTISKNDFDIIVKRGAGICELSGLPLSLTIGGQKGPYGPSIDRINGNAGYTPSNVRIVCIAVNFALNSWGLEAFLPVARALAKRYPYSKD